MIELAVSSLTRGIIASTHRGMARLSCPILFVAEIRTVALCGGDVVRTVGLYVQV